MKTREGGQGYNDRQMVMSLLLLNLAGGDCVDDLSRLEDDLGFARVLKAVETHGMPRKERRALERRWRKERHRSVPSPSSMFRYLEGFRNVEEEAKRSPGVAFIPAPTQGLLGLRKVNQELIASAQARSPQKEATLDTDATLVEVHKQDALFCYKHFRAYQPLNVWWVEQELLLHSEFRDGNVPAGFELRRVFEESLEMLPDGVEKVYMRSDAAGYERDLLRFMAEGKHQRFGVIEFAVGADVTAALKKEVARIAESDWQPLRKWDDKNGEWRETGQEWAEVVYVPSWVAHKKNNPDYRFLVTRERLACLPCQRHRQAQQPLPGMAEQLELPFPTMEMGSGNLYKLHALVTNRTLSGDEIIRWYHKRCGKSEEAHTVMKEDFAGGRLPSKYFGANAAWWAIMILAFNLNIIMKRLVLGTLDESWIKRRMKAIRFLFIALPGRVVNHAREILIRVGGESTWNLLNRARDKIAALAAT